MSRAPGGGARLRPAAGGRAVERVRATSLTDACYETQRPRSARFARGSPGRSPARRGCAGITLDPPGHAGTDRYTSVVRKNYDLLNFTRVRGYLRMYNVRQANKTNYLPVATYTDQPWYCRRRVCTGAQSSYLCGPSTPPSVVRSCDHRSGLPRATHQNFSLGAVAACGARGIYFFKICSICSRTTSYAWPYSSSHRNILCTSINRCRFLRMASRLRFARMDGRTGMSSKGNCTAKPS